MGNYGGIDIKCFEFATDFSIGHFINLANHGGLVTYHKEWDHL